MADWISREVPSLASLPSPSSSSQQRQGAEYGEDVIRHRVDDAGTLNGIEYWATEVAFDVGRRLDGIVYLQTPAQGMHDGGRAARTGSVTTEWFGSGWEERAGAFLREIETRGTTSILTLPYPWGSFDARVAKGAVRHDPTLARATITMEFEEVGSAEYIEDASRPPSAAEVMSSIPDDQVDMREAAQLYLLGIFDVGLTADDLLLLLLELRTQAYLASLGVEAAISVDNVFDLDGIALALYGATRMFPDRAMLAAAWV